MNSGISKTVPSTFSNKTPSDLQGAEINHIPITYQKLKLELELVLIRNQLITLTDINMDIAYR